MITTLVLDAAYQPMEAVGWQRAITLLWEGKVEVVTEYEDRFLHSVSLEIKMPAVVRFLQRLRTTKRAIKFSRTNIHSRDRGRCQYCGVKVHRERSTYDHVIPRVQGGKTEWGNIVTSCENCNQRKRDRTPEQAGMRLRSRPAKPGSLPDMGKFTWTRRKDVPLEWRQFLTDAVYWNTELEHDNE